MLPLFGSVQPVTASSLLAWLPLVPLLGALINLLGGRRLERRLGVGAVHAVAIAAMIGAAAVATAAVAHLVALPPEARFLLDRRWTLVAVGDLHVDFAFALDPLSAVLVVVITFVGTLIHVYATRYMRGDASPARFFGYLNLFVAAMLVLVLGDSLLLAFFGWEGVGLCSYLLIGFWYRDATKAAAARKAFVTNRIGDWGFVVGALVLFWGLFGFAPSTGYAARGEQRTFVPVWVSAPGSTEPDHRERVPIGPTLSFRELRDQLTLRFPRRPTPLALDWLGSHTLLGIPVLTLAALLLFAGACGKSAQLPLQVWLPDAMAGPTPVSALIHAATMVTAGVYLVARTSFLFSASPAAGSVVAVVGVATALVGAIAATVQHDVKRVLAYSTISQLGFMFLAVGTGAYAAGVFHLVTHACFKACLFLAAGSLIHGVHHLTGGPREAPLPPGFDPRVAADVHDPQDLRNMGGLARLMPRTHAAYLVGCVSIAGLPIAAGFYSKDEIVARAFAARGLTVPGTALAAAALVAAGLTSYYMFRSYYLAFHARPASEAARARVHESPAAMTTVLLALAALAIVTGPLLGWPAAWGGHPWLEHFLSPAVVGAAARFAHVGLSTELALQATSVGVALAGWAVARALYRDTTSSARVRERLALRLPTLHAFVYRGLGFDPAYDHAVVGPTRRLSRAAAWLDAHAVDGLVRLAAELGTIGSAIGGWLDRRFVDGVVNGIALALVRAGRGAMRLQSGRIGQYVLGVAVGVVALTAVVLAWWLT